jgi:hypothetical protein
MCQKYSLATGQVMENAAKSGKRVEFAGPINTVSHVAPQQDQRL